MLTDLPLELILMIFDKLNIKDICRSSLTCKTLNITIENQIEDIKSRLSNSDIRLMLNPNSYFRIHVARNQIMNVKLNNSILSKPSVHFELTDHGLDVINVYNLVDVSCCGKMQHSLHPNIEDFFDLKLNGIELKRNKLSRTSIFPSHVMYSNKINSYTELPLIVKMTSVNHRKQFERPGIQGVIYMDISWRQIKMSKNPAFNNPRYVAFLYDRLHSSNNYTMSPTHLFVCYNVPI